MVELAKLDVLPAGCSLHVQRRDERVRFMAQRADGTISLPSGWFTPADGEVIALAWDAFDFDEVSAE